MSNLFKRFTIAISLFTIALTVQGAAPPADQQPASSGTKTTPPAAKAPAAPAPTKPATVAPQGAGGVMVFKDPVTGKIRQPEPGEVESLLSSGQKSLQSLVPPAAEPFRSPAGAGIGLRIGEESMSYMVVTKAPDGKLKKSCVTGSKAATATLSGNRGSSPKEAPDEK